LRVDLERVDLPVAVLEGRRVVLDKVIAGASLARAGARAPNIAGPVTAEGDVEDLQLILVYNVPHKKEPEGRVKHTIWLLLKCEGMSQSPLKRAAGCPQVEGLGLPLVRSEGALSWEKKKT